MTIEQGTMRQVIRAVFQKFNSDETLMRLLKYYPESATNPDPLDPSLPNIIGSTEYWDIVNERILLTEKVSDLVRKSLCRIYITSGKRTPHIDSYLVASQQININVFVHEDYGSDMRLEWINDRINNLLTLERLDGMMGTFNYVRGNPYEAPLQYRRYTNTYQYLIGIK